MKSKKLQLEIKRKIKNNEIVWKAWKVFELNLNIFFKYKIS